MGEYTIQSNFNWENIEIVEDMNHLLSRDISTIEQNIKKQNILFINFAKDNYSSLF